MPRATSCHSLQLPFVFDSGLLLRDMNVCLEAKWKSHFNTRDYSGDWNSIALYSVSGNAEDIRTEGGTFSPTPMLEACTYFREVIDHFQCEKEAVRLLRLAPESVIHEHRDRGLCYEQGIFRLHVPLQTNSEVDFVVGGVRMDMRAGECWYANFDLPHSVQNRGAVARVHLVIDCIRNAWTDELFGAQGYDFDEERKVLAPDDSTFAGMIAELERMNTDASRKLIENLKAQRNAK